MILVPGSTWTFDILLTARSSSGQSAGFQIKGVIENESGTTAFIGLPVITELAKEVNWNVAVEADDANDALAIKVTGDGRSSVVRWVASVRTVARPPVTAASGATRPGA
jgi:hypothetical protein